MLQKTLNKVVSFEDEVGVDVEQQRMGDEGGRGLISKALGSKISLFRDM